MIRDLEPGAWGEKSILDHPLLRGLLTDGFNEDPRAYHPNKFPMIGAMLSSGTMVFFPSDPVTFR